MNVTVGVRVAVALLIGVRVAVALLIGVPVTVGVRVAVAVLMALLVIIGVLLAITVDVRVVVAVFVGAWVGVALLLTVAFASTVTSSGVLVGVTGCTGLGVAEGLAATGLLVLLGAVGEAFACKVEVRVGSIASLGWVMTVGRAV